MSNINTIMEGGDTISGSLAECYYTLNGRRYNGMQFVSVEGYENQEGGADPW